MNTNYFIDLKKVDTEAILLHRFHLTVIFVNIFALGIDVYLQRFLNASLEGFMATMLTANLWWLHKHGNIQFGVYVFLLILTIGLLSLIYINHFATMSVIFVLLLPLLTMLFIRLHISLFITVGLVIAMVLLLYIESIQNPSNPLIENPRALFNLGYTATIIYIFGLLYHLSIIKTFDELDASDRQKALLLKEVHHRVKNNFNVIASIIGLQANAVDEPCNEPLLNSNRRIEAIAMVHEMLYKSTNLDKIDFESYMKKLSDLLLNAFSQYNVVITITGKVSLPLEQMVSLGIIVNELVTNSIKYAFDEEGGVITMSIERDRNHYNFKYSDNGAGCEDPDGLLRGRTLGLKLIKLTVKQLQGEMQINSDTGLHYDIQFKKEKE